MQTRLPDFPRSVPSDGRDLALRGDNRAEHICSLSASPVTVWLAFILASGLLVSTIPTVGRTDGAPWRAWSCCWSTATPVVCAAQLMVPLSIACVIAASVSAAAVVGLLALWAGSSCHTERPAARSSSPPVPLRRYRLSQAPGCALMVRNNLPWVSVVPGSRWN